MDNEREHATCAERVDEQWKRRREALDVMLREYNGDTLDAKQRAALANLGHDEADQDEPLLLEFGLCLDYVEGSQTESGYFRYVLSTGGPADEIRFFVGWNGGIVYAEYWFLDWFDGAHIDVAHDSVVQELYNWLEAGDALSELYNGRGRSLRRGRELDKFFRPPPGLELRRNDSLQGG